MRRDELATLRQLIDAPHGIVLVTGPTGSRQDDHAVLRAGRDQERDLKIITVEDPVEYQRPGISQIQVQREDRA